MIQAEKITRFLTRISPELLEAALIFLARSPAFYSFLVRIEKKRLEGSGRPGKILVIPDINIGDALILQTFIQIIKDYFPQSQIHYIYQRKAYLLIKNNPRIDVHFPLFRGKGIPTRGDIENVSNILKQNRYDLIFNICPYFSPRLFKPAKTRVIHNLRLMADIIKSYADPDEKAHLAYRAGQHAADMAKRMKGKNRFQDVSSRYHTFFFADHEVIQKKEAVVRSLHIDTQKTIILFNPDSASLYTFIPFALQLDLLEGILSLESVEQLMMNCGRTFKNIEKSILNSLPEDLKRKIIIIPEDIPIDVYAALSDHAEIFISGDTGPMHIAAARKILVGSPGYFNNTTALIGIFGGTSSKIYGYDSYSKEHLSSSQDAPAKVFEGTPDCKNLTCIDKIYKKCKDIRCFEGLDCCEILRYIDSYLQFRKKKSAPAAAGSFDPFDDVKNHRNAQEK